MSARSPRAVLRCGTYKLNDGHLQPRIGFGTYKVGVVPASASSAGGKAGTGGNEDACEVVAAALRTGYRMLDCAEFYANEEAVGRAIAASGIPRSEIYLASKVWNSTIYLGAAAVKDQVRKTLQDLGTEWLDLCLIHWPVPGKHVAAYCALQELRDEGVLRSIGVSNYTIEDHEELLNAPGVHTPPAVNQIEVSPFLYRQKTIDYFQRHGVLVQAYRPLNNGASFTNDTLLGIAAKHGKPVAQVLGRWCLAKGCGYLPKTVREERMVENAVDILNFDLDSADMKLLDFLTTPAALDSFRDKYYMCVVRDTPLSDTTYTSSITIE